MATTSRMTTPVEPMRIVLRDVPWAVYKALRKIEANDHVRMTYINGILEIMSSGYIHDINSGRVEQLVRIAARAFGMDYMAAGSTTLRRKRRKPNQGEGREPDASFYFGANARRMAMRDSIDLKTDPAPDLAIEVNNTADSEWKLPIYARLGVSEVWRLDVNEDSLWFGRLREGSYQAVDRSVALPMLTPAWVNGVLSRGEGMTDSAFDASIERWVQDELIPRPQVDADPAPEA